MHKDKQHDDTPHTGVRPGHAFPPDVITRAKAYVRTLDASHIYAFKVSNDALLRACMTGDPDFEAFVQPVFSGTPPTLDAAGQTSDGREIQWVTEPRFS